MGKAGFEPAKPTASVLQTACFDHLHTRPYKCLVFELNELPWGFNQRFYRVSLQGMVKLSLPMLNRFIVFFSLSIVIIISNYLHIVNSF